MAKTEEVQLIFRKPDSDSDLSVTTTGWDEQDIHDYVKRLQSEGFEFISRTDRKIKRFGGFWDRQAGNIIGAAIGFAAGYVIYGLILNAIYGR